MTPRIAYAANDVKAAVARDLETGAPDRLLRKAAAGLALITAHELERRCGTIYGRRVAMLVGTGNNGADALLAGITLRRRGVRVDAILTGATAYEPGVRGLTSAGGRIIASHMLGQARAVLEHADIVLDGILGESGTGGLDDAAAQLADAIPDAALVIAVDLPSGIEPDTGEIHGPHITADITVTFAAWKPATFLPPARYSAGELRFVDVGLPDIPAEPVVRSLTGAEIAQRWPIPARNAHKYTRGVLGVIAGSDTYPGAAVLACLGALESGVGIIRYIGPRRVTDHVLTHVPESVPGIGQVQAWLLGSGVEDDPDQDTAIDTALQSGQPCVVDAGALSACVERRWAGERATGAEQILLTPHAGELSRILSIVGITAAREEVEARPLHYGRELAKAIDATVLVKGATTVIVGPDGLCASQSEAPPWLATAGAGDVLAGIAGTLMAAGLNALDAGEFSAHVHGRAAELAHRSRHGGPIHATAVARATADVIGEFL
ncbi:putative carbohydrate kinase [Nocardia nova SH22a]|uniref:ADP-dependent (S)-NAD(P)H-hydrate dehydratase n=1 Tax=Nocardia nova SH22a TaxID=1415166 RepID=W5TP61_9NOCA|nr:NAD(P)H-hydrate dehydratase [Nocardia nova]AHH20743.1 putative carbohydrate kinase [Nocardia nova SH22a]